MSSISNLDDLQNINQFLEIPYKYNSNSQMNIQRYEYYTESACESETEREGESTCDAISVSDSACVVEKPYLHIKKQIIISNTHIVGALNHLFKYNEEFIENEKMSCYRCNSNHLFTWIYMHMPIIRRNIPNNPRYDPIRLMDEVDLSIGIIGINKFPQVLSDTQSFQPYNIILMPSEYQTFRRKIEGMGIDILACDERRCPSCNAYLAFLNIPYIQI